MQVNHTHHHFLSTLGHLGKQTGATMLAAVLVVGISTSDAWAKGGGGGGGHASAHASTHVSTKTTSIKTSVSKSGSVAKTGAGVHVSTSTTKLHSNPREDHSGSLFGRSGDASQWGHSGTYRGKQMTAPSGGWITRAQLNNPNLKTRTMTAAEKAPPTQVVHVSHYHYYGSGCDCDGAFMGDWFVQRLTFDAMLAAAHSSQPNVYYVNANPSYGTPSVVSPASQQVIGHLQPPDDQPAFKDKTEIQKAMLEVMAQDDDDDANAGLYEKTDNFDPSQPHVKVTAEHAYDLLSLGKSLVFHPAKGGWEEINSLDDLNDYLATADGRGDAPATDDEGGMGTGGWVLVGGLGAVGLAGAGYMLTRRRREDEEYY
jgi:hypothetical protein